MRISDWSSDVVLFRSAAGKPMSAITYHFGGKEELYVAASRYLSARIAEQIMPTMEAATTAAATGGPADTRNGIRNIFSAFTSMMLNPESSAWARYVVREQMRSEEHTSELQSLMRISYAVFCLKKKNNNDPHKQHILHTHTTDTKLTKIHNK